MSEHENAPIDRVDELLCDHVTLGLSDAAEAEMRELLKTGGEDGVEATERAAAAAALAMLGTVESMPADLRSRIEAGARAPVHVVRRPRRLSWAPWTLVAASLTLAVLGWWPRIFGSAGPWLAPEKLALETGTVSTVWAHWSPKPVEEDPEAKDIAWSRGVQGRVIWNAERQEGFMYFSGMKPNDPREHQYQLWIIDANQKQPVDGGVFDIPSDVGGRDVVVRITPKIRVSDAAAFAVTIEKPGGVVVSDQHARVVVAPLGK